MNKSSLPKWKRDAVRSEFKKKGKIDIAAICSKHGITRRDLMDLAGVKRPRPVSEAERRRRDREWDQICRDKELSLQIHLIGFDPTGQGHPAYDPTTGEYYEPPGLHQDYSDD